MYNLNKFKADGQDESEEPVCKSSQGHSTGTWALTEQLCSHHHRNRTCSNQHKQAWSHGAQELVTWYTRISHMVHKSWSHGTQGLVTWYTRAGQMVHKSLATWNTIYNYVYFHGTEWRGNIVSAWLSYVKWPKNLQELTQANGKAHDVCDDA